MCHRGSLCLRSAPDRAALLRLHEVFVRSRGKRFEGTPGPTRLERVARIRSLGSAPNSTSKIESLTRNRFAPSAPKANRLRLYTCASRELLSRCTRDHTCSSVAFFSLPAVFEPLSRMRCQAADARSRLDDSTNSPDYAAQVSFFSNCRS